MPGAIAAGLAAWGAAMGGLAGATLIMYSTQIAMVLALGGSVAIGKMQQRRAQRKARDAYNAGLQDRTVMASMVDAPRSRVYGRARNVDGIVFIGSHGPHKEKLLIIVAVAGHEVDAIPNVYFNDEPVVLDGNGWVQTDPYSKPSTLIRRATGTINGGSGSVTLPATPDGDVQAVATFGSGEDEWQDELSVSVVGTSVTYTSAHTGFGSVVVLWPESIIEPKARVWKFLGAPGQDLSMHAGLDLPAKFPDQITAGVHRFAGMACVAVEFDYDQDAFPSGVPQISALVQGARVYDPRTTFTAWTENPALITRDWALHANGGAALPAEIDAASLITAANACDVTHGFVTDSGTQTLPMYTAGIVCKLDRDPWLQLQEMVEAMAGKVGWAGGKLRVRAGHYTAPVDEITEDWISDADSIRIVPAPSRQDLVNVVIPTIADSANNYVVSPAPQVRAAPYIAADGAEYSREVEYGSVTDQVHAQHVAGVSLRDLRSGLSCVLPCNLRAYPLELFDVVTVTLPRFGWSSKTFEVVSWKWSLTGGILLGLKETAASIYDPDEEFSATDATPNTSLPRPWDVPQITGVSITSGTEALTDGSIVTRTRVAFDAIGSAAVSQSGRIEVAWSPVHQPLPDGDWQSQMFGGNVTSADILGLMTGRHFLFRVRAHSTLGVRGEWSKPELHQVALPPGVAWTGVAGRPMTYRVAAQGFSSASHPIAAGLYDGETGATISGLASGYNVLKINRSTGAVTFVGSDQPLNSGSGATVAGWLNAIGSDHIVVVYTFDEPSTNRMAGGLPEAIYRCGGSKAKFAASSFRVRGAYVLIGIPGIGEGNGAEFYAGDVDSDTGAWIDTTFMVTQQGQLIASAAGEPKVIDTGVLAPGAATDVVIVTAASVAITEGLDSGPGVENLPGTVIASLSYTPPVDCSVIITWAAYVDYQSSSSPSGNVEVYCGEFDHNTSVRYGVTHFQQFTDTVDLVRVPLAHTIRLPGVAGTPLHIDITARRYKASDTVHARSVVACLEAIKR